MTQDAPDHRRVFDERDELETIPAAGTREDVEAKTPLHQLRPQPVHAQRDRRGGALAASPGVVSAYLFGSAAAGREHRENDVDLGVLLPDRT